MALPLAFPLKSKLKKKKKIIFPHTLTAPCMGLPLFLKSCQIYFALLKIKICCCWSMFAKAWKLTGKEFPRSVVIGSININVLLHVKENGQNCSFMDFSWKMLGWERVLVTAQWLTLSSRVEFTNNASLLVYFHKVFRWSKNVTFH